MGAAALAIGALGVAPSPGGAVTITADATCVGADEESQIVLDTIGGSLQVAGVMEALVPASLAPGESAPVSFAIEMKPDQEMIDLSLGVGITAINGVVDMSVNAEGGSGGPYVFPADVTIGMDPPNFPVIEASGTVTAGDGPITYTFSMGTLHFQTVGGIEVSLAMNCSVPDPTITVTEVGAGGSGGSDSGAGGADGSGGQGGASTTLRQGTTGAAQARVTG